MHVFNACSVSATEPDRSRTKDHESAILCHRNPARLSKTEFRICHLLSEGFTAEACQQMLKVKPETLQVHLRSIRLKTKSRNINGLMMKLAQGSGGHLGGHQRTG